MKIGILQTDSVRPELIDKFGDYPDMFRSLFRKVDPALSFETYDVQHGKYPSTIHECDGYVTTGSKASVYDDETWIKALLHYIIQLNKHNKKLLGICFGHQLVAEAFGGKTEHPATNEVILCDALDHAHGRRWTFRQSWQSIVTPDTKRALVLCEAMHESADVDVPALMDKLAEGIGALWSPPKKCGVITAASGRLEF